MITIRLNTENRTVNIITNRNRSQNDKWITVKPNGEDHKGRHLLLEGDETPKQAMERQWGKSFDKKNKPIIRKLLDNPKVREQLASSIRAQQFEAKSQKREPKVGDTILDSDRILAEFSSRLTTDEYNNEYNWEEAEDALFDELNRMEREFGFRESE